MEGEDPDFEREVVLLGEIVRRSVLQRRQDPEQYSAIVAQFSASVDGGDYEALARWLQAFTRCCSAFDRQSGALVDTVLRLDWNDLPEEVLEAIVEFGGSLVSASSIYGEAVMRSAARHLMPPENGESLQALVAEAAQALLGEILRVAPGQQDRLVKVLQQFCPHQRAPRADQEAYLHGVLQFALQHPQVRDPIVTIVLEHCTRLDVDTRADEGEGEGEGAETDGMRGEMLDEEGEPAGMAGDEEGNLVFDMDEGLGPDGQEMIQEGEEEGVDGGESVAMGAAGVRTRLDSALSLLLDFTGLQMQGADADAVFEQLWAAFERTILPTYQSRNIQFILFYACSFQPETYAREFLRALVAIALDTGRPGILRQSAAAYAASFLARAKYITLGLVSETLDTLAEWMHAYARRYGDAGDDGSGIPSGRHVFFYSIFQALAYALCFRTRHFVEEEGGAAYLSSLRLDVLLASGLAPLRGCQPMVASQFARVVQAYELLYCQPYLRSAAGGGAGDGPIGDRQTGMLVELLEDFFPFDPMELPTSWSYLADLYWSWGECEPPALAAEAAATEENGSVSMMHIASSMGAGANLLLDSNGKKVHGDTRSSAGRGRSSGDRGIHCNSRSAVNSNGDINGGGDPDDFLEATSLSPGHGSWRQRVLPVPTAGRPARGVGDGFSKGGSGSFGAASGSFVSGSVECPGFMGTSPAPSLFHRPASRF